MESEGIYLVKPGSPETAFERRSMVLPEAVQNEVIVEVEAFGLNYADVVARKGLYQGAPPFPCILGYEVVGKVVESGPNADENLLGKRVIAFCRFGGYARHVTTHDYAVVPVGNQPPGELLSLCTQGVTAYYMAEYLSPIQPIDKVLIHAAAGGVGSLLIQMAKVKGATVIAKVGSDDKVDFVKSLGADYAVNYKKQNYEGAVKEILDGSCLDISFNPAGGSTFKKDMKLIGSGGRMILFGGSELGNAKWGVFSKLNFVRKMGIVIPVGLMMKSKSVMAVNMLNIADDKPAVMQHCLQKVFEMYSAGKLQPHVGGVYNVEDFNQAHLDLDGGLTKGKLAVLWS